MCAVVGSSFDNTYETTSRSCTTFWHIRRKTTLGILLLQCKSFQYLQIWAKPLLFSISSYLQSSFRHAKEIVLGKHISFLPLISFLGDARSLSERQRKMLDSVSVHKVTICLGNTLFYADLQNILTSLANLLLPSCLRSLFQRKLSIH